MQTSRELPGHSPVSLAAEHVGALTPPPTQQTCPASQLVGVQGGGVHTSAPPPPPPLPKPPPNRGEHVLSAGHCAASSQTWRPVLGHSPSAPGATHAGAAPGPPPLPRQHNSPAPQLVAVHGAGAHVPLLQTLSAPHSASSRQTCTEPSAQLASQDVVAALPPGPPPPPPPVRQQTSPAPQLAALEHDVVVSVPSGHSAALGAQLNAPIGPLQHVRLGATQKLPPPPHVTAPLATRLMGWVGSRFGSSAMLPGFPSIVPLPLAVPPGVG
jgi:hypothetical protein